MNLDIFEELQRTIDQAAAEPSLLGRQQEQQQLSGLRINPQVGRRSCNTSITPS
jgi:hypothetical protein